MRVSGKDLFDKVREKNTISEANAETFGIDSTTWRCYKRLEIPNEFLTTLI